MDDNIAFFVGVAAGVRDTANGRSGGSSSGCFCLTARQRVNFHRLRGINFRSTCDGCELED